MEKLVNLGLTNAAVATLLAIVIATIGRCLTRRPAVLHCLWLLVLLKLVTPPLFEVPIPALRTEPTSVALSVEPSLNYAALMPFPSSEESVEVPPVAEIVIAPPPRDPSEDSSVGLWWRSILLPWLGPIWMTGTVLTLLVAGVRIVRFRRILREAYPAADELQDQVGELAERLGLAHAPSAWWIDANLTPMLWAVGCGPRLIIPRDLWKTLSRRQRATLLAHELAHLRRGDHYIRLLELAVTALYWWLPVVWWSRIALRDAEEQCCDAWVVWAFPDEIRTYAETLLETVDFLNPSRASEPLLASGFGRAHHLRKRLTMIMMGTTPRHLSWGSAVGAFALSALLLPLTPSWAQKPASPDEQKVVVVEVNDDSPKQTSEGKKTEVEIVVATPGSEDRIKTDSLSKAIEAIKKQIETLATQKGGAEAHEAQLKALKQVIATLEKQNAEGIDFTVKSPDAKGSKEKKKLIIQRLDGKGNCRGRGRQNGSNRA